MTTTVNINLAGIAYIIDKDAYDVLLKYLRDIESRLPQDDRKDVIDDVEARVAELLNRQIFISSKQVVTLEMLQPILDQIGAPEAFGEKQRPVAAARKKQSVVPPLLKAILIVGGIIVFAPLLFLLFILLIVSIFVGSAMAIPLFGLLAFAGVILLPIIMIVCTIVSLVRDHCAPKAKFWIISIFLWLACIALLCWMAKASDNDQSLSTASQIVHQVLNGEDVDEDDYVDYDEYMSEHADEYGLLEADSDSLPPAAVQEVTPDTVNYFD